MATLKERLSLTFSDPVWRVVPGTEDKMVLELRNATEKKLVFAVIGEPAAGGSVVETPASETDWWSSLAGVGKGHFFVHSYRNPDIPEPSDLLCFSLETARLVWVLPNTRFAGFNVSGDLVVAEKKGGELIYLHASADTGQTGKPVQNPVFPGVMPWREPERYRTGEKYHGIVENFIRQYLGYEPVGSIEYLDSADKMIFSFYLYENETLAQYVAIVNRLREVEYLSVIEKNLEKEGTNLMMVKEDWLYFVKDRKVFVGINLIS